MDEDQLNMQVRKFLKKLGVTSQREIEDAVRAADAAGALEGRDALPVRATVTIEGLDLEVEVDGEIRLG